MTARWGFDSLCGYQFLMDKFVLEELCSNCGKIVATKSGDWYFVDPHCDNVWFRRYHYTQVIFKQAPKINNNGLRKLP